MPAPAIPPSVLTSLAIANSGGAIIGATPGSQRIAVPVPSVFSTSDMFLPSDIKFTSLDGGLGSCDYTYCNYTAEQIFDLKSTARSSPANTYWVDPVSGSDSNAGTEAANFQTLGKAIATGSAAASPFKVRLKGGGAYTQDAVKTKNFTNNSSSTTYDSVVDFCVEFYNGVSVISSHADFATPSLYTGASYTYAIANTIADNVVDRALLDENGWDTPMNWVPFVASGDLPPGNNWSTDGTTVLIRRADMAPVTNLNTRIFDQVRNFRLTNNISVGLFPATDNDSLVVIGGGAMNGPIDMLVSSSVTDKTPRAFVAKNVTALSYNKRGSGSGRCWSIDGLHGIVWLENCWAGHAKTDHFNFHCTRGALGTGAQSGVNQRVVMLNCHGDKAGIDLRPLGLTQQNSCNGPTAHEDVKGFSLGGSYGHTSGGTLRNIGSTKWFTAGEMFQDFGERSTGSTLRPTAIRAQDAADIYVFRPKFGLMPSNSYSLVNAGTGVVAKKDVFPSVCQTTGTITDGYQAA
ncbi:MAG: hypothetical protein QM647_15015 [Asticcacaulis sp.]|uniref:hypothetical protein n=1 Tax=Asticcacaulis sp. TaxID=1872648 RepID=UPI0039E6FAC5